MKTTLKNFGNAVVEKFFDCLPALVIITIIALIVGFFAGIISIGTYFDNKHEESFLAQAEAISYETVLSDVTYSTTSSSSSVTFYAWFENNIGEEIRFEIPKEEYREYIQAIGKTILVTSNAGEEYGEYVEKDIILDINYDENNLVAMEKTNEGTKDQPVIMNNYQN